MYLSSSPSYDFTGPGHQEVTFTEGVAHFKGLWRFYYGGADKSIGLAEINDIAMLPGFNEKAK